MTDWEKFFERQEGLAFFTDNGSTGALRRSKYHTVEELFQAFKARGEAEAKEKQRCWCPDGGHCVYSPDGLTGSHCNHPSKKPPVPPVVCFNCGKAVDGNYLTVCKSCGDKAVNCCLGTPPEPECEHGRWNDGLGRPIFKKFTDKHCRGCGEKLMEG